MLGGGGRICGTGNWCRNFQYGHITKRLWSNLLLPRNDIDEHDCLLYLRHHDYKSSVYIVMCAVDIRMAVETETLVRWPRISKTPQGCKQAPPARQDILNLRASKREVISTNLVSSVNPGYLRVPMPCARGIRERHLCNNVLTSGEIPSRKGCRKIVRVT